MIASFYRVGFWMMVNDKAQGTNVDSECLETTYGYCDVELSKEEKRKNKNKRPR
jgi:hypothetical protein